MLFINGASKDLDVCLMSFYLILPHKAAECDKEKRLVKVLLKPLLLTAVNEFCH